jgi:hypothetical protein
LTPAPRCQDHTLSPSASSAVRYRRFRVHRSPSRVRDDRESPLKVGRDGNHIRLICDSEKQKYFSEGDWTRRANQP